MKNIYILLGFLCVLLGIIGIPTPVLPTTPFLLVALFFFSKGSPRIHHWFMQTRLYQRYLKDYDSKKAMTLKQKISILVLSFPFCLLAFFTLPSFWGKLGVVLLILIQCWYFFCRIETLPDKLN